MAKKKLSINDPIKQYTTDRIRPDDSNADVGAAWGMRLFCYLFLFLIVYGIFSSFTGIGKDEEWRAENRTGIQTIVEDSKRMLGN